MSLHFRSRGVAALIFASALAFCLLVAYQVATGSSNTSAARPDSPGPQGLGTATASPTCPPLWRVESSPNPSGYTYLHAVTALSPDDVWAVGYYLENNLYRTLTQHWNGTSWSIIPSPNVNGSHNYLFAVDAVGPNDIWAVGNYDWDNLTMHWDGTQWSIVPSPNFDTGFDNLNSVSALATDDVWAVGSNVHASVEQVVAIHWDGNQWTLSDTIQGFYTPEVFNAVEAVATDDVWAVGSASDYTLIEHWNGTEWAEIPAPSPGSYQDALYGIAALAPDDIWAVGQTDDDTYYRPLVLHWNGSAWSVVPAPSPPGGDSVLRSVSALAPDDIWAVGYADGESRTLIEHWDGTSWSIVSSPSPGSVDNILYGVAAITNNDVVAVGIYDHTSGNARQTLIERYTTSCASTHTPTSTRTSTTTLTPTATPTCDVNLGWHAVMGQDPGVAANVFNGVAAISPNDAWAVGYYQHSSCPPDGCRKRTLVEHWNGSAWSAVTSPNNGDNDNELLAIGAVSPTDIWAVGYKSVPFDGDQAFAMHWDGVEWSIVEMPAVAGAQVVLLQGMAAIASGDVWAAGYAGSPSGGESQTITMHWNGSEWAVVPSPNPGYLGNSLSDIIALGPNEVWAAGTQRVQEPGGSRTLIIRWDGSAWSVVPSPDPGPLGRRLNAIAALSPNDIWVLGDYQQVNTNWYNFFAHWDGAGWTVHPVATTINVDYLSALEAISSSDIWAVGTHNSDTFHTLMAHWDGAQWSTVATPDPLLGMGNVPLDVAATSSTDVWAVGRYSAGSQSRVGILRYGLLPCTLSPTATHTTIATTTPTQAIATPSGTATSTPCSIGFSDVPKGHTFYAQIRCLACRNILGGYPDGTFRPGNDVTRGQLAKIVANAAGYNEPVSGQTFTDVPPNHTFYLFIERMAARDVIRGYSDGTFRPGNNATRGQISKIVSSAANFTEPVSGQRFSDVLPGSTFYEFIERLAARGILGGYSDGTFRPGNNATRGQVSKVVANTFYPGCVTP
jgi:hypothetical protein